MTKTMTAALVALALAGGTFAVAPAKADSVTVTTTTTDPAFGYQDGYWDRGHAWHNWSNHDESVHFEKSYHTHYYNKAHTDYPDSGWRHETWWQK